MSYYWILPAMAVALIIATLAGTKLADLGFSLPEGRRIGCIDGLRGYLALSVMCHHYIIWLTYKSSNLWAVPDVNFYSQLGQGAVSLFFMITGLVFYPYVSRGIRGNNWTKLYVGRIFRITPMLLFSTLVCALIVSIEYRVFPDRYFPLEVAKWIAGKQGPLMHVPGSNLVNGGVLWSLSWEWIFYFSFLPVFIVLRTLFKSEHVWIFFALLMALAILGRMTGHNTFRYMQLFIIGMLVAELIKKIQVTQLFAKSWMAIPLLAALAGGMTLFHDPYGWLPMSLFTLFFLGIASGNDIFGLLSTRGARVLGEISFSIYLIHGIVLYVAFKLIPVENMPVVSLSLLALIAVLAASACFAAIEKPGMGLGRLVYFWVQARIGKSRSELGARVASKTG